jgi:hypothetical protein
VKRCLKYRISDTVSLTLDKRISNTFIESYGQRLAYFWNGLKNTTTMAKRLILSLIFFHVCRFLA